MSWRDSIALSACEKVLFRFLQHNAETDFYWDYDDYYLKNTDQEAGMSCVKTMRRFLRGRAVAR